MPPDRPPPRLSITAPKAKAPALARVYAEAVLCFQNGRMAQAEALCRRMLLADPQQPDSLVLLGAISTRTDRPALALDLIGAVLQRHPNHSTAHFNLALALQALGRNEEAVEAFGQAASLSPNFFPAWFNLANALRRLGRMVEAEAAYRGAIALEGGYAPAHFNLGNTLQTLGRAEEAAIAYRQAIALKPDYEDALINLGGVLRDLGRSEEAAVIYQQVGELSPGNAYAHYNLGGALRDLGRHEDAVAAYRRALALRPDYAEAHNNLGAELATLGHYDDAVGAYERAVALKLDYAEAYVNLASAQQALGQMVQARTAVEAAVRFDPKSARAWFTYSDLKVFAKDDPDISRMEALLAQPELDVDERLYLGFAAGKAWMDAGSPVRAFSHLTSANQLKRSGLTYAVKDETEGLAAIARAVTPQVLARFSGAGAPSDLPVFVVGMPRSGTSLVEQVLASHPQVEGAGELTILEETLRQVIGQADVAAAMPQWIADAPPEAFTAIGARYLEAVKGLSAGKQRLVDKMPGNFQFAGLIAMALPNARIIHCRRDPIDTCLSCYSKHFNQGQEFSYDLEELGQFYRAYDALMAHWRQMLPPDRFLEVQYEDVVADLEAQARRLVAFCGLEWSQACLAFHNTRRPVRTASASQVRQPIYRSSVARGRAYATQLSPLLEALGPLAHASKGPD